METALLVLVVLVCVVVGAVALRLLFPIIFPLLVMLAAAAIAICGACLIGFLEFIDWAIRKCRR